MIIYILRHGYAEPKSSSAEESQRPLTFEGIESTRRILKLAKDLGGEVDRIVSSPYKRAVQTAEIANGFLISNSLKILQSEVLEPDSDPYQVYSYLVKEKFDNTSRILLVSHQPLVGNLITDLVSPDMNLSFPPGSMARVDATELASRGGRLIWLVSSDVLGVSKTK